MRLSIIWICWLCIGLTPSFAVPQPSPADDDARLIARVNQLAGIHRQLFRTITVDVRLPVAIGFRKPPFLSIDELVAGLEAGAWTEEVRTAIESFLDETTLDARSDFFSLDPVARAWVVRRPKYVSDQATRTSAGDGGKGGDGRTVDLEGAISFAREKRKLKEELGQLTLEQRRALWFTYLATVGFRNEARTDEDKRVGQMFLRRIESGAPAMSPEDWVEAHRLEVAWDRAGSTPFNIQPQHYGPNQYWFDGLSQSNVSVIAKSSLRRPASPATARALTSELKRLTAQLVAVLEPSQQERLKNLQFELGAEDDGSRTDLFDSKLWFEARRSGPTPTIKGAGAAVYVGFATCSARLYQLSSWNTEGLLRGNPVDASNRRKDASSRWTWPQAVRDRTREQEWDEVFRITPELDAEANRLTALQIVDGTDNPMPISRTREDARRITEAIIRGFDRCIDNYFAFVVAHELAHLYLAPPQAQIEPDEMKVDCAAISHLRRWKEVIGDDRAPTAAQGFMQHLLDASLSVEAALTRPQVRSDVLAVRLAALREGRCMSRHG